MRRSEGIMTENDREEGKGEQTDEYRKRLEIYEKTRKENCRSSAREKRKKT